MKTAGGHSSRFRNPFGTFPVAAMLLLAIFASRVYADFIYLKNGNVIEGYFVSQDKTQMVIDTLEGEVRVPAGDVKKMEMGYSGIPVCYSLYSEPKKRDCSKILHSVNPERAIIVPRKGSMQRTVLKMGDVSYLTFHKDSGKQKLVPLVSEGLHIEFVSDQKNIKGTIVLVSSSKIQIREESGAVEEFPESALITGTIFMPLATPRQEFHYYWLVTPGIPQLQRGEWIKGGLILFSLAGLGAGGYSEYAQANRMDNAAMGDIRFLLFNSGSYYTQFQQHQNNQKAIGGAALLVYLYHLYDIGLFSRRSSPPLGPGKTSSRSLGLGFESTLGRIGNEPDHFQGLSLQYHF